MNVSEIMASIVQWVDKDQPLVKVAGLMKEYDIGCIAVGGDKLEGLITDRDIVCRAVAAGKPMDRTTAGEVMTPKPVTCRDDDTLKQAAAIMERNQVRRLPVLDYHDRLVGIVSMGDISTHAPHGLAGELVGEVSKPEHRSLAETV